jgi:hypothetical protein
LLLLLLLLATSHRGGPGSRPGLTSGIFGGQSGVGASFLRVLRFPLPKTVHSTNFIIIIIIIIIIRSTRIS